MLQHNRKLETLKAEARQKEVLRNTVRERFARWGDKPCAVILEAAFNPFGLPRLLEKLGLQPVQTLDEQLDTLSRYFCQRGAGDLLKRLNLHDPRASAAAKPEVPAKEQNPTPPRTKVQTSSVQPKAEDLPMPEAGRAPAATPPEWFDTQSRYVGPERRSGTDRRSGHDRRQNHNSVSRNNRFGGDRRKFIRRAVDRACLGVDITPRLTSQL